MLLAMVKVQIIGVKQRQDKTVQILQQLGAIQIDPWSDRRSGPQQRLTLSDPLIKLRERLAYAATRIDALLTALPAVETSPTESDTDAALSPDELLAGVEVALAEIGPQIQTLMTRQDQLEQQLSSLARYETTLRQLLPVTPILVDLERYAVSAVWVEQRYQPVLAALSHQLDELTGGLCEVVTRQVNPDMIVALLIFPKEQATTINELLGRENISQVRLPPDLAGQSLDKTLATIRQQQQAIPQELAVIKTQQLALARVWHFRLLTWQNLLRDHLAALEVRSQFGQTEYTFVIGSSCRCRLKNERQLQSCFTILRWSHRLSRCWGCWLCRAMANWTRPH
jgi:vacuolar-type H+-ATPase subunit I/STV1